MPTSRTAISDTATSPMRSETSPPARSLPATTTSSSRTASTSSATVEATGPGHNAAALVSAVWPDDTSEPWREGAMVSIWEREAVAELLDRLGREATLAFASRGALRVVPLMAPLVDYGRADADALGLAAILAAWRAAAASWFAAGFATG